MTASRGKASRASNASKSPPPKPLKPSKLPKSPEGAPEPPWWRPVNPKGRRRQPLTRDAIVNAAVKLLDADGIRALTVRRLAEELGTGSASLYWHIRGKDELGELVYDHVMGEVELPVPDPSIWQEQCRDFARQAYRVMLKHKDLVLLSIGHVPVGPNMLRIIEWNLDLLRGAGMPDRVAAYIGDIFGRFLDASVMEASGKGGPPIEQVGAYFAALPPSIYPNITRMGGALFEGDDDDRFEFGLELLLKGMAAYVSEMHD